MKLGRISTDIEIINFQDPSKSLEFKALIDTAAAYLTLPLAWKEKLGALKNMGKVKVQFSDQKEGIAEVYGPIQLRISNFREIFTEVLFLDMDADQEGRYEPLLGYIPLEQLNAQMDMNAHKLTPLKFVDLK